MGRWLFARTSRRGIWWGLGLAALLLACRVQVVGPMTPDGAMSDAADSTPPTIARVTSPAEVYFGNACGAPVLTVQVWAQDDAGTPAQVWLEYAYAGASQARRLPLSATGNDGYVGQIPVGQEAPQALPQGGALYYRVWATDAAGNQTVAPGPDAWFTVAVIACANGPGGAAGAAVPPFAPPAPGGSNPGGSGSNPPPGAPPPSSPPGGASPPGGSSPNNPPGSQPPAAPPPGGNPGANPGGGDDDLPVICYPNCGDGGDDGIVMLPPEYQPYPPEGIVIDPGDIGGNDPGGNDPGGQPGGNDPGGNDPGGQPGGNDPGQPAPQPPAQPGTLVVVNQSSFPVVSLQFMYDDPATGQRKQEDVILGMHQVIPSNGGSLTVNDLEPGVVYSVMPGIGFWDASGRTITGYLAPQIVQVQPGETASITIANPSVQELVTQFGTVTRYKGFVMGGSPLASHCVYLDLNGSNYTLTIVHESGQTVLDDTGSFYDTYFSENLGFVTLQFSGGQTSFEANYHYKGPQIGSLNLMDVNVPGYTVFPFIEMRSNSSLCP